MIRISIPTDGDNVSSHFGRCPEFTVAETDDKGIIKTERINNPGHFPGAIPQFLKNLGVSCIVCGGIGARALELFNECDIEVIQGVAGRVEDVVVTYFRDSLTGGGNTCSPGGGRGYGLDKHTCDHD